MDGKVLFIFYTQRKGNIMSKVFTHAGTSRLNGVVKARFANDAMRVKVLTKGGHTDIDLVEFLEPLTKIEAVMKLIEMDFAKGNTEVQAALEAELDKRTPNEAANKEPRKTKEAKKPKKAPAPKAITLDSIKAKAPTKSKEQIEAELKALEDAPY
jgi:hypothetical protein